MGLLFVGVVGCMFDCVFDEVGIECMYVYLMNVVKYFKWELCGKWWLYKMFVQCEVVVCYYWFECEL